MSATQLTERHRAAQLTVRALFLRELLTAWPLLDPMRLEQTAPAWIQLVMRLVSRYRQESAAESLSYYVRLRDELAPVPGLPPEPVVDWRAADAAAETSLRVLGPVGIKQRTGQGVDPAAAARTALVDVSAASARHVLDGGRDSIRHAVDRDELAIGFARYASPTACAFCKMLASRGAVYESRGTALRTTTRSARGEGERYHDGCACMAVPIFSGNDPLPPGSDEYARLWADATTGFSGKDALNAFRRAVEGGGAPTGSTSRSRKSPRREPVKPTSRRTQLTAEIATLEKTFAGLQRRRAAGENVDRPYTYQRDRLAKLRAELRDLG